MNPRREETIFDEYDGESPVATELRRLYQNARRRKTDNAAGDNRSFLLTSSHRGEGKSTLSSYLAVTVAQFPRKKVLLVDADLRRPRVHKIFGVTNELGLKDCLAGGLDPMKVVKDTPLQNLHVITAGDHVPQPGRLFESDVLKEVIDKVSFYHDVVVIDSAPVLSVSDTLFLCPAVDTVLVVVLAGVTPRAIFRRTVDVLTDSGARIGGVVMNNVSRVLPYHYDYRYYGETRED